MQPIRQESIQTTGEELGRGGQGVVLGAVLRGQHVALKVLHYGLQSQQDKDSLIAEIDTMSKLSHENIVRLIGFCITKDDCHGLIMEHMAGGDLSKLLKKKQQTLPWFVRIRIARDVARGLAFLHSREVEVVHCDLKSPNVLLTKNHTAKITDFGISQKLPQLRTQIGKNMAGSWQWQPPEQIQNPTLISAAADIWSFGVICWEIASCKLPLDGFILANLGMFYLKKQPEEVPKKCRPQFATIINQCRSFNPKSRPKAQDVFLQLQALVPQFREPSGGQQQNPNKVTPNPSQPPLQKLVNTPPPLPKGPQRLPPSINHLLSSLPSIEKLSNQTTQQPSINHLLSSLPSIEKLSNQTTQQPSINHLLNSLPSIEKLSNQTTQQLTINHLLSAHMDGQIEYEAGINALKNCDYRRAEECLQIAANVQYPPAYIALAELYRQTERGDTENWENLKKIEKETAKWFFWYCKEAEKAEECLKRGVTSPKIARAFRDVAHCFYYGYGTSEKKPNKAVELWTKANSADAFFDLGEFYARNPSEHSRSYRFYKLAAEEGHIEALVEQAICLKEGFGIKQDHNAALNILKNAALNQGHPRAHTLIGLYYYSGLGPVKKDYSAARQFFGTAAAKGSRTGFFFHGICIVKGLGGQRPDPLVAMLYIQRAADRGLTIAQEKMWRIFWEDEFKLKKQKDIKFNFEKNRPKLVKYIAKSALKGNQDAQFLLSRIYKLGKAGCKKNRHKAAFWLAESKKNHDDSQQARIARLRQARDSLL